MVLIQNENYVLGDFYLNNFDIAELYILISSYYLSGSVAILLA